MKTLATLATIFAAVQSPSAFDFQGAYPGMPLNEFKSSPASKGSHCQTQYLMKGGDPAIACSKSSPFGLGPFQELTVEGFDFELDEQRLPRLASITIITLAGNAE